jgi:hypothetical protein
VLSSVDYDPLFNPIESITSGMMNSDDDENESAFKSESNINNKNKKK